MDSRFYFNVVICDIYMLAIMDDPKEEDDDLEWIVYGLATDLVDKSFMDYWSELTCCLESLMATTWWHLTHGDPLREGKHLALQVS